MALKYGSRCISLAICVISSNDGVIKPDKPIMSAFSALAMAKISATGTITPMLTTSKLLHCNTTETIFLPISCTSPFTVAITILPLGLATMPVRFSSAAFSASMNGIKCATACFMTRADFTTCGKNIFPWPNRSPTTFMPSISGPSITWIGLPPLASKPARASSVSSTINSVIPCTMAWLKRFSTGVGASGVPRHSSVAASFLPPATSVPAISIMRSVAAKGLFASTIRFNTTSSTRSRSSGAKSS